MFGFFKKKDSSPPRTSEAVINLLEAMGYTITNDGIGMIALELECLREKEEDDASPVFCQAPKRRLRERTVESVE